jgi:hypothetical protein
MARGSELEEFIGPREVSEERERKAQQPSAMTSRVTKCERSMHRGQIPIPIPAPLARLSFPRSTKSEAGPIVCGPRKSKLWSK